MAIHNLWAQCPCESAQRLQDEKYTDTRTDQYYVKAYFMGRMYLYCYINLVCKH